MAKRIAIVGRHPVLEPGFNAAMSLNEALGFEAHGCHVTLYLPISSDHDPHALLARAGFAGFDTLPRFGGSFDIVPFHAAPEVSGADVLVWQSYRASEHPLLLSFRGTSILRTKNAPRIFTGFVKDDRRRATGLMQQFDLMALSLRADARVARSSLEDARGFRYVPRGFVVDWLNGTGRTPTPTIGMDRAIKTADDGARARAHIVEVATRLRGALPSLHVLTLRETIESLASENVPNLPLRDYYDRFLNRLWLYFPIDFEHSVHVSGYSRSPEGRRLFTGLYENQIVEAQIAGGLVIARRDDIPRELVMLPKESIVDDYEDGDALFAAAMAHIEHFEERSRLTRAMARERHSHIEMTRAWLAAIDRIG